MEESLPVPSNITYEDEIVDPAVHARFPVMVLVFMPIFLVAEVGNAYVIYSLGYLKRHQRTLVDSYILNLALADVLITTLSLYTAIEYVNNKWDFGQGFCKIHGQMLEACWAVSSLTLLVISYTRRNVVNDPFKVLKGRKALKRNMALIWSAALFLTTPLSYAYTVAKRNGRLHCSNTNFDMRARQIYYLLQASILFFVPVTIMIDNQRHITKDLRRHSQIYTTTMENTNVHWARVMTHGKRVSKFLTWIWVTFVCCFMPSIVMRTINHFTSLRRNEIWNQVWMASLLLILLNSAINPFLYFRTTSRNVANDNGILKIFCCIRRDRQHVNAARNTSVPVLT